MAEVDRKSDFALEGIRRGGHRLACSGTERYGSAIVFDEIVREKRRI